MDLRREPKPGDARSSDWTAEHRIGSPTITSVLVGLGLFILTVSLLPPFSAGHIGGVAAHQLSPAGSTTRSSSIVPLPSGLSLGIGALPHAICAYGLTS